MSDHDYVWSGTEDGSEVVRFRLVEAGCDPATTRCLNAIGVTQGWRCLEVGAGGGSVARWLAERVGPDGNVVAIDVNPRFLTELPGNVTVRALDIRQDTLPEGVYDLVHARLLLIHMADPVEVLTRMAAVLRPGGVLLAEEPDVGLNYAFGHPDAERANDLQARLNEALRAAGADYTLGRRLPAMLGAAGLEVAGAEFTTEVTRAGDPLFEDNRLHDAQLTTMLLRLGFSEEEVAFRRSFFDSPGVGLIPLTMVSTWGRRGILR